MLNFVSFCLSGAVLAPSVHYPTTRAFVESLPHEAPFARLDVNGEAAVRAAAKALWDGDGVGAQRVASFSGYQVMSLQTDTEWLWLLVPGEQTPPGHATFVVREGAERDVLVEAPHVPYDPNTAEEAADLFDAIRARGLLIAGAPRCASEASSGCDPAGHACDREDPPDSDVAHAVHNAFHAIHTAITAADSAMIALQLHANHEPADNGDVLISNGTRHPVSHGSLINSLAQALRQAGIPDVRTCNDPNSHTTPMSLCGSSNVQGRVSNGATHPCREEPSAATGRFVHVEQSSHRLRYELDDWVSRLAEVLRGLL